MLLLLKTGEPILFEYTKLKLRYYHDVLLIEENIIF